MSGTYHSKNILFLAILFLMIVRPAFYQDQQPIASPVIDVSTDPVTDPIAARSLVKRTIKILAEKGIHLETRMDRIKVELRTREKMKQLVQVGEPGGHHRTRTVTQGDRTWVSDCTLTFLKGQREDVMMGVAAHELFHLWQSERGASKGWIRWIEGTANVAKYLVLVDIDNEKAQKSIQHMMEDRDPVYGKGFRKALKYYDKNGMKKYLEKVYKECGGKPK
ncbi:MAG: protein DA1 [Candidatus Electryonea clarkiae]|nr:protein DA1 [Candidatus Electryonea clarkiae]MDP8285798.1 protein DA1 [Candidatus Electryonea clarkiae]